MWKANHTAVSCLLPGLLLLAGCRGTEPERPERVDVTFSILGADTRTTATEGEGTVERWTLLLYRDGRLADLGTSTAGTTIVRTLAAGTYTAFAVVNPPESFRPEAYTVFTDLSDAESDLRDNRPGRFVMTGSRAVTVPVPDGGPQTIGVDRLVVKAGVRKVSIAFTDPVLASRTFRLKAVYLTNCYGKNRLGSDWGADGMAADASRWYNRMGFHSDEGVDGLLADRDIDTDITPDRSYGQAHYFYCYPNRADGDSRSGDWSVRHTRLVLEAEIGDRTYYYPVTLPAMQRNKTYLIEEAVIRKLGSNDPERDEPGSIDVRFSTSTGEWDPVYTVQEHS